MPHGELEHGNKNCKWIEWQLQSFKNAMSEIKNSFNGFNYKTGHGRIKDERI